MLFAEAQKPVPLIDRPQIPLKPEICSFSGTQPSPLERVTSLVERVDVFVGKHRRCEDNRKVFTFRLHSVIPICLSKDDIQRSLKWTNCLSNG